MQATKIIESSLEGLTLSLGSLPEPRLIISSTTLDLREHRKQVKEACQCQGIIPIMMEDLPINNDEAISASLTMANQADIYLGIFGFRYGYVPAVDNPEQISITEIEYNHAVIRKIPRLIFMLDETHSAKIVDSEEVNLAKLAAFKKRLARENAVISFKSPAQLRNRVFSALTRYRLCRRRVESIAG